MRSYSFILKPIVDPAHQKKILIDHLATLPKEKKEEIYKDFFDLYLQMSNSSDIESKEAMEDTKEDRISLQSSSTKKKEPEETLVRTGPLDKSELCLYGGYYSLYDDTKSGFHCRHPSSLTETEVQRFATAQLPMNQIYPLKGINNNHVGHDDCPWKGHALCPPEFKDKDLKDKDNDKKRICIKLTQGHSFKNILPLCAKKANNIDHEIILNKILDLCAQYLPEGFAGGKTWKEFVLENKDRINPHKDCRTFLSILQKKKEHLPEKKRLEQTPICKMNIANSQNCGDGTSLWTTIIACQNSPNQPTRYHTKKIKCSNEVQFTESSKEKAKEINVLAMVNFLEELSTSKCQMICGPSSQTCPDAPSSSISLLENNTPDTQQK